MAWTRTNHKASGTFSYTVWDFNGRVYEQRGMFTDYKECERAAEAAERKMTFEHCNGPMMALDDIVAEMDDEDILKELGI